MSKDLMHIDQIQNRIFSIRNIQIMVDRDLTELYVVETKVLNQAVKRNLNRFPELFRFQLTDTETKELVTNCDRYQKWDMAILNILSKLNNKLAGKVK